MTARRARNLSAVLAVFFGGMLLSSVFFDYGYSGSRIHAAIGNGAAGVGFQSRAAAGHWIARCSSGNWTRYWWVPRAVFDRWTKFVLLPLWIPAFLTVVAFMYFHRKVRRKPGHCRKCEYDLTGNVSGICPECGTRI